ncbi:MAG: type IV toxin-antitoxin system AbiEi family antitoxin domain-containing protein [Proteobacteria bacterium]|nr:type IV toxin-antitoxin system AbiEi family antitoxin domain-containing protein [Pseudomonadota bacterium]MBU4470756.1 type IV toxin-antitoxin system AbiEi family antitoxin domain-containing protein [Pseudomonadota bacterium]MCG2751516.1 type IV toxin-antitoxin system AbiEi family antitoxin domain-containing protein [Desulfobacteraceae bacterium]
MNSLSGIGKTDRERIAAILRGTKGTVSVGEAADILEVSSSDAAKMLARWTKSGWMARVRRGYYVPVSLESRTTDVVLEDSWIVAERLFSPCYIGGWSAAEYLDLTEQIFNTVVVMTVHKPRNRQIVIKGTSFLLKTIPEKALFGQKPVWRGQVKVSVSDSERTLVDMLSDPSLGGGIRSVKDMLTTYLASERVDLNLLINYARQLGNGAVFKRLGFLMETMRPEEKSTLDQCRNNLTAGNAKLDPALKVDKLVTRWRLWVPESWTGEMGRDID